MVVQAQVVYFKEDVPSRLDLFLSRYFTQHSRTYFQNLIKENRITLNDQTVKKRTLVAYGDKITIHFMAKALPYVAPQNIALDILYEDAHFLVINKPPNMVVHPAPGHRNNTVVNALLSYCQSLKNWKEKIRPGVVHRLDKDTSGVLIAAKTEIAHGKLTTLFAERKVHKSYLAVTTSVPKALICTSPIARHPTKRKEMTIDFEKGKEAVTECTVLKKTADVHLLLLKPQTGRTHQLRVHLKALNAPIIGDPLYGSAKINRAYGIQRQLLHAQKLEFIHPFTNRPFCITAPLPKDMYAFCCRYELENLIE